MVAAGVRNPDPALVYIVVVKGQRKNTAFHTSLTKKESRDLQDIYRRVEKYLRLEASLAKGSTSRKVDKKIPKVESEDKDNNPNGKGKKMADDGGSPQGRHGR